MGQSAEERSGGMSKRNPKGDVIGSICQAIHDLPLVPQLHQPKFTARTGGPPRTDSLSVVFLEDFHGLGNGLGTSTLGQHSKEGPRLFKERIELSADRPAPPIGHPVPFLVNSPWYSSTTPYLLRPKAHPGHLQGKPTHIVARSFVGSQNGTIHTQGHMEILQEIHTRCLC